MNQKPTYARARPRKPTGSVVLPADNTRVAPADLSKVQAADFNTIRQAMGGALQRMQPQFNHPGDEMLNRAMGQYNANPRAHPFWNPKVRTPAKAGATPLAVPLAGRSREDFARQNPHLHPSRILRAMVPQSRKP